MLRRLLPGIITALLCLAAPMAQAHDVVRLVSPTSTNGIFAFTPSADDLVGMAEVHIVSRGQTRLVGRFDFLDAVSKRGTVLINFTGSIEDPNDPPPLVQPTFPPETAELLIQRDNTRFCPGADLLPSKDNLAQTRAATLCLINLERTSRNIKPLKTQKQLTAAAQPYAEQMVRERFFAHTDPRGVDLGDRLEKSGYWNQDNPRLKDITFGENLVTGLDWTAQPRFMVAAWMDSEGHRENMLNRYFTEIGIGISPRATTGEAGGTYVTDFGQRIFYKPKPKPKPSCKKPGKKPGAKKKPCKKPSKKPSKKPGKTAP